MTHLFPQVLRRGRATRDGKALAAFEVKRSIAKKTRPKKRSKKVRRKPILALLKRFGGLCAMCGTRVRLDLPPDHPFRATVDHITPLWRGGKSEPTNLQLACYPCNQRKGASLTITAPDKSTEPRK